MNGKSAKAKGKRTAISTVQEVSFEFKKDRRGRKRVVTQEVDQTPSTPGTPASAKRRRITQTSNGHHLFGSLQPMEPLAEMEAPQAQEEDIVIKVKAKKKSGVVHGIEFPFIVSGTDPSCI